MVKKAPFRCNFWQVALLHVATVHPAVNWYLAYRTVMEIVRMIATSALTTAGLYANMRVEIAFKRTGPARV